MNGYFDWKKWEYFYLFRKHMVRQPSGLYKLLKTYHEVIIKLEKKN